MSKRLDRMTHRDALSLWTLKLALIEARLDTPPRNLDLRGDDNEELARTLIARVKTGYDKPLPLAVWRNGMNRSALWIKEMAGSDD